MNIERAKNIARNTIEIARLSRLAAPLKAAKNGYPARESANSIGIAVEGDSFFSIIVLADPQENLAIGRRRLRAML